MRSPKVLSLFVVAAVSSVSSIYRLWGKATIEGPTYDYWSHSYLLQSAHFKRPPATHSSVIDDVDARHQVRGFLDVQKPKYRRHSTEPSAILLSSEKPKWAYAFLMAGVDVHHPSYLGIFYNILVSVQALEHSQADIVVMVQMSLFSTSPRLTTREEQILTEMNVRIYYLDVSSQQNFYTMQLEKFRILEMTEYSRVLYMDGDVMPFCSLDYLFELSSSNQDKNLQTMNHTSVLDLNNPRLPSLLRENIVLAWRIEPAHGGFFMLAPHPGDYEQLQSIIRHQEERLLAGEDFSKEMGWGHVIVPPDSWHSTSGREGPNATEWSWHGDFADQGLLYYWTKYYKKDVSLIIGTDVEHWVGDERCTAHGALNSYGCVPKAHTRPKKYASGGFANMVPYRDFKHFTGRAKPWLSSESVNLTNTYEFNNLQTAQEFWFYLFRKIQRIYLLVSVELMQTTIPLSKFGGYPTIQMARDSAHNNDYRAMLQTKNNVS